MVCVVTSAAVASPWCSAEVGIALSRGSRVLPVRAEPGVDHPLLRSAPYADVTQDPDGGRVALAGEQRPVRRRWWPTSGRHYDHDHGFGAESDTTCHLRHPNRDLESQAGPSQA